MGALDDLDLSLKLSKEEEAERLDSAWVRLTQLRLTLGGLIGKGELGPPVCVIFEGGDASGKGGAIKRLVAELDSRHVRVRQFAAPTSDEKRHHFLWRFWPALPGWGGMTVLDRSWYGRVLVERVEGFAEREPQLEQPVLRRLQPFARLVLRDRQGQVEFVQPSHARQAPRTSAATAVSWSSLRSVSPVSSVGR